MDAATEGKGASGLRWVTLGLLLGIVLGGFFPQDRYPQVYELFRFCSKAFIALVKSVVVPILVSTIITGIAQTGDIKAVGRMGAKALVYFEVVTTFALGVGLLVANVVKPGIGLPLARSAQEINLPPQPSAWVVALHAFPTNLVKHAAEGDVLPVVVFAALFGIALTRTGEQGRPVLKFFEAVAQVMFKYTAMVMALTPIGVFGAMAYNVSHMAAGHTVNGVVVRGWPAVIHLLGQYARMVGSLYLALFLFMSLVFVPILLWTGVGIARFARTIREPVLTAFSTASSESVLAQVIERVGLLGVPRRVASFVIPAGYSFNLDGSTLYLVLASLAIAQAAGIDMPIGRQVAMLFTFMLTSKGVAAVPRATLVIIAGTCASFGLPGEAGVAMLLAVDELMDMARTATNVTGNALAAVVVAKWEGVLGHRDEDAAEDAGSRGA